MWENTLQYKNTIIVGVIALIIGFMLGSSSSDRDDDTGDNTVLPPGDTEVIGGSELPPSAFVGDNTNSEENGDAMMAASPVMKSDFSIEAGSQRAGNVATLSKVALGTSGWAVIHEDNEGMPGNILGAAWFAAGEHTNASVKLLREMTSGRTYYAVLHFDEGDDHQFDHEKDLPFTDEEGNAIGVTFQTIASASGF